MSGLFISLAVWSHDQPGAKFSAWAEAFFTFILSRMIRDPLARSPEKYAILI